MTRDELRLELLRITKPHGIDNPDVEMWLARAKAFEAWVKEPTPGESAPLTIAEARETPKRPAGAKPVDRTAKAVYTE
jgi:hypothetical protein